MLKGSCHSLESRKKLSLSAKGRVHSAETRKKMSESKKGNQNPLGFVHSMETRRKMSLAHTAISIETRKKMSDSHKGDKASSWKGGVTPINEIIRKSFEYKLWREAVFKRDDYSCVLCGVRGGDLQADHIKRFAEYPELRFDVSNGRTLCVPCHRATDTFGWKSSVYQIHDEPN